jgi:protein involved in sex pheromone biosynthesis
MTATATKKEQKQVKEISSEIVMKNLHDKIGIPYNYSHSRGFNVYDNRWRINVYSLVKTDIPTLIKRLFISNSYFVEVDKEGQIVRPKEIQKIK